MPEKVVMYWLVIALAFFVIEMITFGLTTIWFSGGALIGALLAFFGVPLWSQIAAFVVVSLILLFLTRPLAVKYVNRRAIRTNADSLIGQECIVTKSVDNLTGKGEANVNGQISTARGVPGGEVIPEGRKGIIVRITGAKIVIRPIAEKESQ